MKKQIGKLSGVLFDFNGTLFFDSKIQFSVIRATLKKYGGEEFDNDFLVKNVMGMSNKEIVRKFVDAGADDELCESFRRDKEGLYYETCLNSPALMKLADGACELLDYLAENSIPYCMVTGSSREEVDFYLEYLSVGRWFSYEKNIVYVDGSFKGKPEPDCYLRGADRLGLSPSQCLVFEDGASGIKAAHSAGAGGVIAVYEEGVPSPSGKGVAADAEYHGFASWREILSRYGLLD